MKTVIVLASFVALALAGTVPTQHNVKTKAVDAEFVVRQKKILSLFEQVYQVNPEAEYYKIGKDFDFEAHSEFYTNKKAFEEFFTLYRTGFLPKHQVFSIFYERLREEAISLFHLFYYAKDFETFYKTACWARVYLNEGQFLYAYYIAVIHRADTKGFVLPAPYEAYPQFFANNDAFTKMYATKMQDGLFFPEKAAEYGIFKESDYFVYYANYSTPMSYSFGESKLSYFTEDIGLNSYYYYFHSYFPFWMDGEDFGAYKERRGEAFYFFYKQLLARYYLERLTNGLGEIPTFSWYFPIKYGYSTFLSTYYPFYQRNNYYQIYNEANYEYLQYLDTYEKTFLQFLEQGHFKAYNQEIDLHNSKAINFVGNYFQSNADLYKKTEFKNYEKNYEIIAQHLLSGAPEPFDRYTIAPGALEFYQTALRDPVFYQFYSKVLSYFLKYKEYLAPYTQDYLHYVGVKISDVKVDKLVTFFDFFDFDATNGVFFSADEFKTNVQVQERYKIRQPRLNHNAFNVNIDVKSEVAGEAIVKIFLGPKYDSNGYPIKLEDNWMNFVELDWFKYTLKAGQNMIERNSQDFFFYKEDSVSTYDIYKFLEQGKVPTDMSEEFAMMPNRLMLPKGTYGGFPFQFFVMVYPYEPVTKEFDTYKSFVVDNKPFSFPFDRPVKDGYFYQPNMFFEDVQIYHEGEYYPIAGETYFKNVVPKH